MAKAVGPLKRDGVNLKLLLHLSLSTVPLIAFTAILLGLVYYYSKLFAESDTVGELSLDTSFRSDVLYVNLPATRLILVASWSSSVALPIIGSLLTLTSYTVAADMIWSSRRGYHELLPNPSQIAMLTDLLDAKQMAIVTWLASFWRKDGRKVSSRWIVEFPAIVQLAALSLSAAVIAADTWLHIATKSVTKSYLSAVSDPETLGMSYFYSRALKAECNETSTSVCTVEQGSNFTSASFKSDIDSLASRSANYPTCINSTINSTTDGRFFLAPQLGQWVGQIATNGLMDQAFTASSFNVSTSCEPATHLCNSTTLNSNATAWGFTCDGNMAGEVNQSQPVQVGSWFQGNGSYADMFQHYEGSSLDVVEFGFVMLLMNVTILPATTSKNTLISARCNSTLTAVQFDWINKTLVAPMQSLDNGPNPGHLARLARGPLLAGYLNDYPPFTGAAPNNPFLNEFVSTQNSKPVSEYFVLSEIEIAISFYGLSLLGGTFDLTPAESLSLPETVIVTQVGKAPFFTLAILNLWYSCFGIMLFGLAKYMLRDPESTKDIREVQALISVHGLATAAVKRHRKNLDSSDLRVGVEKVDDVWQFRVFEVNSGLGEGKPLLNEQDEEEVAQAWDT